MKCEYDIVIIHHILCHIPEIWYHVPMKSCIMSYVYDIMIIYDFNYVSYEMCMLLYMI